MNMNEANAALNKWLNDTLNYIKNMPNDEKYSWSAIAVGCVLIIVAIIIW